MDDDCEYQWSPVLQNNLEISFLRKIHNLTELKECILSPVACKTFCSNVLAIKTRALTALANIFLVPSSWLENNAELATSWWNSFANGALSVSNMDPIPIDLFEAYVACMWSFTRLLMGLQLKLVTCD